MTMNTSGNDSAPEGDERHAISAYLSDMLALERHIARPIASQLRSEDHQIYVEASRIIARIKTVSDAHIAALDVQLKAAGGNSASSLKSAWSMLLGGGAAVVDQMRKTKVSKSLRDDYTALSLAAISYTMLHAAATGLGDDAAAQLAKAHLDDLTPIIVDISRTIPTIVLQELRDDGEVVSVATARLSERETSESWSPARVSESDPSA